MVAKVTQINVFPVKSAKGITISSALVEEAGLSFDRQFMISLLDGSMVTARSYPQLVHISPALSPQGVTLRYQQLPPLQLIYNQFEDATFRSEVWGDQFDAFKTTDEANEWISKVVGKPAVLLFKGNESVRFSKKAQQKVSFADAFPVLIISEASLDDLNERSTSHHTMEQFRTNLVVSGTRAFEEDSWKKIKIGDVVFEINGGCSRCILTTVNPQTAELDKLKEPLTTLASYRSDEQGKVYFGQNLIACNEGLITEGDEVIVIERQSPTQYVIKEQSNNDAPVQDAESNQHKSISISINGHLFSGNNQQTILEQAEGEGIRLPYSCRSGFCGACKILKESGEVADVAMDALLESEIEQGYILACCSTPMSDIELVN